jgi:hypothetical protein
MAKHSQMTPNKPNNSQTTIQQCQTQPNNKQMTAKQHTNNQMTYKTSGMK